MKRLLATSVFTTAAYSLTLFAGARAASADAPAGVVITWPSTAFSPATAALIADGDDIRATFIIENTADREPSLTTEATEAPDVSMPSTAMAALLADGDDIRARALAAIQN